MKIPRSLRFLRAAAAYIYTILSINKPPPSAASSYLNVPLIWSRTPLKGEVNIRGPYTRVYLSFARQFYEYLLIKKKKKQKLFFYINEKIA